IYSLGVTLYELSTHHHPAGDLTDAQLLLDRRRFSAKPLTHWNRHIPVDFQTIVLKSIAEFPGERYATAQDMADDLTRFLEGKPILASPPSFASKAAKWVRRHQGITYAAAAVLFLAFVGQFVNMLVLAAQKRETEHALATAQENMRQALGVLEQFGTSYPEQLAAVPGAETIRARMLNDSLKYYEQFAAQSNGDAALATDLALAYDRIGTLRERLEQRDAALENHRAARTIWLARIADDAADVDAARNLALCENNIALLQADSGKVDDAIDSLQQAYKIQQDLLTADANAAKLPAELATTCNNLGLVLRQTDRPAEAMEQFRLAIARLEPLVEHRPKDESALRVLAAAHNNLGSLLDASDAVASSRQFHQAIDLQRRLVDGDPINRLYQGDLARTYNNLGYALVRTRDWQNAELCYLDAIKLQRRLVAQSPRAGSYSRDLAISYNNLGMVESRDARFTAAEESFTHALELQNQLLKSAPGDAVTLSNLGSVYNNFGLLFDAQRRFADAESNYQQAIAHQKQALDKAPENPRYRELLSNHYANFAKCLESQQKQQAAAEVVAERNSLLALQHGGGQDLPQN
ncbi:MAG: tetratricopeptide repeat protein, partial [Pirellulales bacterium]